MSARSHQVRGTIRRIVSERPLVTLPALIAASKLPRSTVEYHLHQMAAQREVIVEAGPPNKVRLPQRFAFVMQEVPDDPKKTSQLMSEWDETLMDVDTAEATMRRRAAYWQTQGCLQLVIHDAEGIAEIHMLHPQTDSGVRAKLVRLFTMG